MTKQLKSRQLISQNFDILRVLKDPNFTGKIIDLKNVTNEAKPRINSLINCEVVDENLIINPNKAYFLGVSITKGSYSISLIGLDGVPIKSKEFLDCLKLLPQESIFNSFLYDNLYRFLEYLNKFIGKIKIYYQINAICFSFDDVYFNSNSFSFANYYQYPFMMEHSIDSISSFIRNIDSDTEIYLECNSNCYLIQREFNYTNRNLDVVYVDISKTGCFVSKMIANKIHYGYNFKSLNVTAFLDQSEKTLLNNSDVSSELIVSVLKKLTPVFAISLCPNYFLIGGTLLSKEVNIANYIRENIIPIICEFNMQKNYLPEFEVDTNQDPSVGAAISAMYQYYDWDYVCEHSL